MQDIQKSKKIKAICFQMNPSEKSMEQNMTKALKSLEKYTPEDKIDIIMFCELSFTNYCLTAEQAALSSEERGKGPNFKFGQQLSIQKNAYTVIGYIERVSDKLYNSVMVIDRTGQITGHHQKVLLFPNDKIWASEGPSFNHVHIINTDNQSLKMGLAICMDIQYKDFIDPNEKILGDYLKQYQCDGVLFVTAWNDFEDDSKRDQQSLMQESINYWIDRISPIVGTESKPYKQFVFICCNRVGQEEGHYIGTSCVIALNPPRFISALPRNQEGVICAETALNY